MAKKAKKGSESIPPSEIKKYYSDITERKRKRMKEDMMEIAETVDSLYPYNFVNSTTRTKNGFLESRAHFNYCVSEYERFAGIEPLTPDFVDTLYLLFKERFYTVKGDNYNALIKYISYITSKSTSKEDIDHKAFRMLYENYSLDSIL